MDKLDTKFDVQINWYNKCVFVCKNVWLFKNKSVEYTLN